jgi:hypothetical protein
MLRAARLTNAFIHASMLALSLLVGMSPRPAAAKEVTYEACVVDRKPTSALMNLGDDEVLFELDLRPIPNTPFALNPGDCVSVTGLDRDNEPGLRREYPQAGWLVEAATIAAVKSHLNPSSSSGKQDED